LLRASYIIASLLTVLAVGIWLAREPSLGEQLQLVDRYCLDCHNSAEFAGDLSFEGMTAAELHLDAEIWERAVAKLDAGLMPPPGEPRPEAGRLEALATALKTRLDEDARLAPNPGAPLLHRMNRAEYGNAIRDLLDLQVDAGTLLPADDAVEGFDNIADALGVSPALMQAYVSAAQKISRLAVGDMTVSPANTSYTPERGLSQAEHIDGMPLGTRGGFSVEHQFPLDSEYEFRINRGGQLFQLNGVGLDEAAEFTLDGERIAVFNGRGGEPLRIAVPAGPHQDAAAIVQSSRPSGVDDLYAVHDSSPGILSINIMGPIAATGPGDTPSRRRIFSCVPAADAQRELCATEILTELARRALRRPHTELGPNIETLLTFYRSGAEQNGFATGIQHALARLLVDPQFIFRFEREPVGLDEGAVYPLDDFELASRLSFFLWSSIPDDALLLRAAGGELGVPGALESEVLRMLGDSKAEALVQNFASQWLGLRTLDSLNPVSRDYDANLRLSFERETRLLFASLLEQDRSVVDLLTADYSFVDERLARHYDIPNIRGSRFRRVDLEGTGRRGLLGHGSILTGTSSPTRTSPVIRGAWILENILGTPPPSPPPGVESNLDEPLVGVERVLSQRQRLERHRADPSCAACHQIIDPLGFSLENFDLTGRWRETDRGAPIDASGMLWDGTALNGPEGLRRALVERQDFFVQTLTERLMTYALGRGLEHYDMPAVRGIVERAAEDDYRLSAILLGIVESVPFRYRTAAP
jgi:hypothetical protein